MKKKPPQKSRAKESGGGPRKVRFEATIHPGRVKRRPDWMDHLEVDRVPDPGGDVRALLTPDDCTRLLDRGYEIRLHHAHHVRPLDPSLIETDESVRRWMDKELRGLDRAGGKPPDRERS